MKQSYTIHFKLPMDNKNYHYNLQVWCVCVDLWLQGVDPGLFHAGKQNKNN